MSAAQIEQRFRWFLLVLAGLMCVGTAVELWLQEHTGTAVQFIPFVLCGAALLVVILVLLRPSRGTIWTLRLVMALVISGSLFGMFEHFEHNLAFEMEIRPTATAVSLLADTLHGASPMLAPGILALTAVLALAATYYHPALGGRLDD